MSRVKDVIAMLESWDGDETIIADWWDKDTLDFVLTAMEMETVSDEEWLYLSEYDYAGEGIHFASIARILGEYREENK
jgi:hypothetical protein